MIFFLTGEHCWETECTPAMYHKNVHQRFTNLWPAEVPACSKTLSNKGLMDFGSSLDSPRFFRWTLPESWRVNPLKYFAFLHVGKNLIHPAPSPRVALDQAVCDCILFGVTSNICPGGVAVRFIPDNLVERLRLYDGACKARFACRGRQLRFSSLGRFNPCVVRLVSAGAKILHEFLFGCRHTKNEPVILALGRRHSFSSLGRLIRPTQITSRHHGPV